MTEWLKRLAGMKGRIALTSEEECDCLARYSGLSGNHVEIGTLWGGTAILSALAKKDKRRKGSVYTIDPMVGGWWNTEDPTARLRPTLEAVLENIEKYNVTKRIEIIKACSNPWPLSSIVNPRSIFIDGNHNFEYVYQDWINASKISQEFVIFHDYWPNSHPGIRKTIDEYTLKDKSWKLVEQSVSMMVFQRI